MKILIISFLIFSTHVFARSKSVDLQLRFLGYLGNNDFKCTGLLIAPDLFLTAAHCPSSGRVKIADADQELKLEDTLAHVENVLFSNPQADIKVLKLKKLISGIPASEFEAIQIHKSISSNEYWLRSGALRDIYFPELRSCRLVSSTPFFIQASGCPSVGGFSGGPLFLPVGTKDDLKLHVFGVLSSSLVLPNQPNFLGENTKFGTFTTLSPTFESLLTEHGVKVVP